jgi:hypothetical protein
MLSGMAPFHRRMIMLEKHVVTKIQDKIKDAYPNSITFKTHGGPFQMAGLPDLVGCINGRFIGIEVKAPGKEHELSRLQMVFLKKLHKAGAITFMSSSADHSLARINDGLKGKEVDPFELYNPKTKNKDT